MTRFLTALICTITDPFAWAGDTTFRDAWRDYWRIG